MAETGRVTVDVPQELGIPVRAEVPGNMRDVLRLSWDRDGPCSPPLHHTAVPPASGTQNCAAQAPPGSGAWFQGTATTPAGVLHTHPCASAPWRRARLRPAVRETDWEPAQGSLRPRTLSPHADFTARTALQPTPARCQG